MRKLHIAPETTSFAANAIELYRPSFTTVEDTCPHCKEIIRYPLMARERDVAIMQELINMASKWLDENGVTARMFTELTNKIRVSLLIKEAEKIIGVDNTK